MALSGPRLDHLADRLPRRVDTPLGDAAAHGRLLDHLALRELAIQLGLHHIGPLLHVLVERHVALDRFHFDTHS